MKEKAPMLPVKVALKSTRSKLPKGEMVENIISPSRNIMVMVFYTPSRHYHYALYSLSIKDNYLYAIMLHQERAGKKVCYEVIERVKNDGYEIE